MDFNQLNTFVKVVETGSFSRAGERLFLSQPTVTTQIKLLEQELSQQLLTRSTNGIRVTEAGKKLFEYAKRTLRDRENILGEFGQDTAGVQTINVAASSIPGQYVIPQLISLFHKNNPQIRIRLNICNSAEVCQALLERTADFGMGGSDSFQGDCDYLPIVDDPLVVATPNTEPYKQLAMTEPFPDALLQTTPFVMREEGSGSRREFEKWQQKHMQGVVVNIAAIINDNQAIKEAVAGGTGITVISARAVVDYVKQGLLRSFPLEGVADRKLYLVRRKKFKLMGDVADFYQFIKEYAAKHKMNT